MLTINFILVFFIIASAVFYFYFKTRQFRTRQVFPIRKKMYASMSGASLGGLLLFFGLNQLMLFNGVTTYVIAALFIALGIYVGIFNYRAYKHYRSFVDEETKLNEN
ncbi:YtpI family protein [Sporosarcina sp. JAI121]|uniref:YtpI family protein n=1 Tax=Sporosarcina sp. JAI121 TaxID=2723064 RepID=UPI0015CACCA1|nr:YtpI family protein [Sporosarcina sp. JAI121]NYF25170.1 amino acid transporter [Sporosarcina sp. JAI121]